MSWPRRRASGDAAEASELASAVRSLLAPPRLAPPRLVLTVPRRTRGARGARLRAAPLSGGVVAPQSPGGALGREPPCDADAPDAAATAVVAAVPLVDTAETRRVGTAADVAGALALLAAAVDAVAAAPPSTAHTRSSTPGSGLPMVPGRRAAAGSYGLDVFMPVSVMP